MTGGNAHDSTQFEKLLTGSEVAAYADSAYKSKKHSELLRGRKIEERITHRAYRNTPLKGEQHEQNRYYSGVRCLVEHVFGIMKLHYGVTKARYLGLSRNQARIVLVSMAYNLKRAQSIQRSTYP